MSESNLDFSFDDSGQFLLVQVYLLGVALQIDRYQKAIAQRKHSKITGLFMQLHEVSCLLEDLDCTRRYFSLGKFEHPLHQLWQTGRDHIRHDIRDLVATSNDLKRKNSRHKSLNMNERLVSKMTFNKDNFTIGETVVKVQDIKDYLDWANNIFQKYIEHSRDIGLLTT